MKVLAIAHNCVGVSNRRKFDALAAHPDLEITLLTPSWWFEEGQVTRQTAAPGERYRIVVGRTLCTNNGTRHAYLTQLPGLVARLQPDVIDLHEEPFSAAAFQTALLRDLFAPRAALVFCSYVNLHRIWRRPYRWFERYTLRRADAVYAPNGAVPEVLRAKAFRGPIQVIPMGVDLERFHVSEAEALGRTRHGPPWTIGFLGRLEPVKGLPVLLEAFARLPHDARLAIVGDGPERPGLDALAARLQLQGRVEFRPAIRFEAVPSFLASLDALVLPSVTIPPAHKEQFGRVLVEAMACGVPVVGSSSGGIPEVIGEAGIVVPEGRVEPLAQALAELLDSAERRQELIRRGLRRAREVFAWPRIALQYRALYELGRELRQQRLSCPSAEC
ncbi:MAG: glycosyltransferase [Chloroflexi bacterium]|nr:glycosyltransferase [Chloroflexota bacterium]